MKRTKFYLGNIPAMLAFLKRATCLLVVVCSSINLMADEFEYLGYTYSIMEGGENVSLAHGTAVNGCIVVPTYAYDGDKAYPVIEVGESAFENEKNYTKVVIGDNVQNIRYRAFYHFGEGTTNNVIIFGKKMRYISTKAFPNFGRTGAGNKVVVKGDNFFANSISVGIFQKVKNTTFYLRNQATYDYFMSFGGWHQFDASESTVNNSYQIPFPVELTITPGKWQTAIFPEDLSQNAYESYFGKGTKWAMWTSGHDIASGITDGQASGTYQYVYFFSSKTGEAIPANTPILLKAGNEDCQYVSEMVYDESKCQLCSDDLLEYQKPSLGHKAYMMGATEDYTLKKGEFYLRSNADVKELYFFQADNDRNFHVRKGKCWFRLTEEDTGDVSSAKMGVSIDGETTGIANVETEMRKTSTGRIYSLTGQYEGDDMDRLPKGIHIVNGKKIIIR